MVKKKGIVLLLSIVFLLVVVLLSLPSVLSSSMVLRIVLDRVNARSATRLQIKSCSIGWNRGLECRDIRFRDSLAGVTITIPRLTGSQGLLALMAAPKNLGQLTVYDPQLVLSGATRPGTQGAGAEKKNVHQQPASSTAPVARKAATKGGKTPFWEGMRLRLLVQGGTITSRPHLQEPRVLARELHFTSGLADGSIAYTLGVEDGTGQGKMAATGFVNLPVRRDGLLDTLVSMVDFQVTGFQIQNLLALAAGRNTFLPKGRAVLSGNLSLKTAGLANLSVKGDVELRDLSLQGGVLGTDRPRFAKVALILDADRKEGRGWVLDSLAVNSDAGTIKAKGAAGPVRRSINLSAQLELPVLAEQVPGLMRMRKGVRLNSGEFGLSVNLDNRDKAVRIAAKARVEQLSGAYEGHPFVWTTPLTLNLEAEGNGKTIRVGKLQLASSFLKADGRGDMKAFSLHASADLGKGFQELGLLFDQDWRGKGKLDLRASSRALADNRYAMDLSSTVDGFSLLHAGRSVIPAHRLNLELKGRGSPNAFRGRGSIDIRCDLSAWPGTFHLVADNLSRKGGDLTSRYRLATNVDLARLTDLLHNLEILPRQTTVTGGLDLQAQGFVDKNIVAIRQIDAGVDKLLYLGDGFTYRDAHVRLHTVLPAAPEGVPIHVRKLAVSGGQEEFLWAGNGNSAVNVASRGLYLRNVQLISSLGQISVSRLEIFDWQRIPQALTADIRGGISLAALTGLLQTNDMMNNQLSLAGNADFRLRVMQGNEDNGQHVAFELRAPVSLKRDDRKILENEQLVLQCKARRNRNSEDLLLDKVAIDSRPLSLKASGLLSGGNTPALTLKGSVTPDLEVLAAVAEAMSGTPLTMSGRRTSHFDLFLPLDRPTEQLVRQMHFSAGLQANTIQYRGINLNDLTVPIHMDNGILKIGVHSIFNGGRLAVDPVCRFTTKPPLLTIPDKSRVLTGVQLEQPFVEGVLSRLHPLFGVLARPTGTLDMELTTFSWPLVGNGADTARFQAVFDVSKITLDSVGVLSEVLAMTGLDREKLRLKDSTITCTGAEGRITCTPVRILMADSEMVISGSVGMDKTLDYLLQIPVTRKLVGKEGYRVLEGTTIKVPIRGTLGRPVFDRETLTSTVADLARQAAGKAIRKEVEKALPGLLKGLIK